MHIRRISVALASTLVAYGAWYTYKGPSNAGFSNGGVEQTRSITTSRGNGAATSNTPESTETRAAENTRKAVVVTADSIYTGSIEGDEPISKYTDNSGRKVLEMLTPEQATQKLRNNEESYFVGRGQGVVRYDVVQIPSNDPIEDDHSEKIVEVPHGASTATAGNPSSDWMFWGIYDGHRYVHQALNIIVTVANTSQWLDNLSKAETNPD